MKLPKLTTPDRNHAQNVSQAGSTSEQDRIVPAGECGCSRNRHCLGPCVMGSCLGTCVPNV